MKKKDLSVTSGHALFSERMCLHQKLEECVAQNPENTALIFRDETISFKVLHYRSNVLAAKLQAMGVQKGDFVALCMERSPQLIIGIFAILKAGGAYVPIDVDHPLERLKYMLEDSGTKVVLSQSSLASNFANAPVSTLYLDTDWEAIEQEFSEKTYQDIVEPDDLAYMIYTSGSTGKPKGVMITHRNVMNQLEAQQAVAPAPIGKMLLTCSISFDVSVTTIFWALLQGAPLAIPDQGEEKDIQRLAPLIEQYQITHMMTLPSLHTMLLEDAKATQLRSLELVIVIGEVCPTSLAQKHEKLIPQAQFYNLYGPTEATVTCTAFPLPKGYDQEKVPIGMPMLNYDILILNEKLEEVEAGEIGEIYIGGSKDVVAKGYWNRPKLTAERFIPNPFEAERGGKMLYKTGDLGKWMSDGNIEFLGRADYQVKFRGYRIELGEIEVTLSNHEAIKDAVLVLQNLDTGLQRLIAYLVFEPEKSLNVSELRSFLTASLPEYMVPSHFVFLDEMPLNVNGKIDRKALPEPKSDRPNLAIPYASAQSPMERFLVESWEDLLGIAPIGIDDKFFELGGSSIQAGQFIAQLQKALGISIFITTIFDKPTIRSYAQMLHAKYPAEVKTLFEAADISKPEQESAGLTIEMIQAFEQYVPKLSKDIPVEDQKTVKNPPAIFILAPPRSGTSLLRTMLAGHPELFAVNELQLLGFHTLRERAEAYSGKFAFWQEGAIRMVMELKQCSADEARSIIHEYEKKNYTTKAFFNEIQSWLDGKTLVEKSPSYVCDPAALQKAERDFDNAIYIHLVRHPYSMVNSFVNYHMDQVMYLNDHNFTPKQLGELVWLESHKNTVAFLDQIPANRQYRLRYEDLVTDPEQCMKALCETIGLDFHSDLLSPYKDLDKKMTDGIHKDSRAMADEHFFQHKGINPAMAKAADKVKEDNFLSEPTWDIATKLGYSHPKPEVNPTKQTNTGTTDIAIIGMSLRVAGADNLLDFWTNLVDGKDVGKATTAEDLINAGLDPNLLNKPNFIPRAYSLDHSDCFDAGFFGYHPKEVKMMDPQHRVFLETAYAALENAGYDPSTYKGRIGVMGGLARNSYFTDNIATHEDLLLSAGEYADTLGTEKSFGITRVAYKLNLKGPAVNIQTACSSSGTAIHMACQSILSEDSDIVIAGGGRVQPSLEHGYFYKEGGPLSPDGYIRAFDSNAQGMVRGNGMALIVLKRLDKALEDGDHIWAVIKGTAINNDGSEKIGFTAPSIEGQAKAILSAQQKAGITADELDYIEAHGTGTILGDPIEIQGLTTAFRTSTDKKQYCAIGSVKTNVGHLDAGACAAGIIKTALAMKFEQLPPSLNFRKGNPQIDFEQSPFYVNHELRPWKSGERIRRAGVSSFGLGGTNAHIILEEAPTLAEKPGNMDNALLLLSAKTPEALHRMSLNLADFIQTNPNTSTTDIAYTLATGRQSFKHRRMVIADSDSDPIALLRKEKSVSVDQAGKDIVFLFPGGGAQYLNMAKDLYLENKTFQKHLDHCFEILAQQIGLPVKELVFPASNQDKAKLKRTLEQPTNALATLFSVEYALARTWMDWGIQPKEMIGHSMGEYTAACIAGVFSLEDALALVVLRGQLFESLAAEGAMLSTPLKPEELQAYLDDDLSISVINKPDNCVVSGTAEAIDRLTQVLSDQGIDAKRIHIAVAAHSAQIDPILEEFRTFLETITFHSPNIPFISNVSGTWAKPEEVITAEYWVRHIRETVRFSDGLATLFDLDNRILLEVGPGQTLSTFARQHPAKNSGQVILASTRHPKEKANDVSFIFKTLGNLWLNGLNIDWKAFYATYQVQCLGILPSYPFERKSYWIAPKQITKANITTTESQTSIPIQTDPMVQKPKTTTTISRKEHILSDLKQVFFELSGLEPDEMDQEASFLELGFDSLFLTQAVAEINKTFQVDISFRQLFDQTPTLESLMDYLDEVLPETQYTAQEIIEEDAPQVIPQSIPNVVQQNTGTTIILQGNSIEELLSDKIEALVEQKLNKLLGEKPGSISTKSINKLVKKEDSTQQIKRKIKGVTSKMKNYENISSANDLTDAQRQALANFIERYIEKTKSSKALTSKHRKYYADPRAVTGFSPLWKEIVYQIASEKSKGSRIWDIDGNEYIDYVMSYGVALFGHMPDFIAEAVTKQIQNGNSLDVLPPKAAEVAEILCELSGMERITLANTGTEAVLGAVRAARTYTGKEKIAVFNTDYHGLVDQFLVRGVAFKDGMRALPSSVGVPKFHVENVLVLDYDDPDVLDTLEAHIGELAGVLIEPIQAQNPHWQHHELIREVRAITAEHEVPLIFDEVINGFRLNQRGAQAWYGIEADIVAYGKTISGGLPLSATAGKEKYMTAFDGGLWQFGDDSGPEKAITYFASTFIKNPLSVSAAHAALSKLKEQGPALQEELNEKAARFCSKLRSIFLKTKAPLFVQNTSSIFIIKPADKNPLTRLFNYYFRMYGVNVRERPCFVSTAHTEEDFQKTYKGIEAAIKAMFDDGLLQEWEGEDMNAIILPNEQELVPVPLPVQQEEKCIALTAGQQEIWLNNILSNEASCAYNIGSKISLTGDLQIDQLNKAIELLIQRHESLRTTISANGKQQIIHPTSNITLRHHDLRAVDDKAARVKTIAVRASSTPFDLQNGPLIHFDLVHLNELEHELIISVHHIICDGWSLANVCRDLGLFYTQLTKKQSIQFAQAKQLSSYAQEQESWAQDEGFLKNQDFWLSQYEAGIPKAELPSDFPRPSLKTFNGSLETKMILEDLYKAVRKKAAQEGTTFFFFMMAAFKAFIYRLSGEEDFVTGLAVAGHNQPGNADMVGHCINFLPLRSKINGEATFAKHLKTIRTGILDAFDHQNYTFGALMKSLKIARDPSRNALISMAFNMDSPTGPISFGDLNVSVNPIPKQYETFDLFLNLKPIHNSIRLEWNFNTDLYTNHSIQNRLNEFVNFIQALITDTHKPLDQYQLLTSEDSEAILALGKGPKLNFPLDQCLHQLFEAQAKNNPEQIAVSFGKESISYKELNLQANRLSRLLLHKGFKPGARVGIFLDRSIELIISIYAVLKTGGSYVPLDPLNPDKRLELMIEDAETQFVISNPKLKGRLQISKDKWIILDQDSYDHFDTSDLSIEVSAEQEAYVIYTSGSTGKPKGVGIHHSAAVNTLFGINQHLQVGEQDIMYSVSSMGFDMSIPDFFLSLISGAQLVLAEADVKKDGFLLRRELETIQPTVMQATPTTWKILLLSGWSGNPHLKAVAGGEAFPRELAQELLSKCQAVWNGYGPTETTIYAAYKRISSDHLLALKTKQFAAIGQAIANVEFLVLDKNGALAPLGIPGELYIGGPGVSKGYLNRPELTQAAFVNTSYSEYKLYKTGDLVRMLPNGDIDFLGRIDQQVKIRGFRIELGEIEEWIKQVSFIKQCAVTVVTNNNQQQLVAYVSLKGNNPFNEETVQKYLRSQLPGYMVPKHFVVLEQFPLSSSLKINRKALPIPNFTASRKDSLSLASTATEQLISELWNEILGIAQVDIHSDFFELGGHSLAAVELMAKIKRQTGKELPITALFQNATIAKLANLLDQNDMKEGEWSSLVPIREGGSKPPLYLVHGGGLHVLFYQTMTRYLDPEQPIYALQARGLDGKQPPLDTIEEMAAYYIKEIKASNPNGPYLLAGYSLGGLIAYEMAKQLMEKGKQVPLVALFDAIAKADPESASMHKWTKVLKKIKYNLYLLAKHPVKTISYKMNVIKKRFKFGEDKIAFRAANSKKVEEVYSPMSKLVYEKSLEAFAKYEMQPLPIAIDLFKAKDQMFYLNDFEYLGWQQYAEKGVRKYEVEGNHYRMFDAEYGKGLAEQFQASLNLASKRIQQEIYDYSK